MLRPYQNLVDETLCGTAWFSVTPAPTKAAWFDVIRHANAPDILGFERLFRWQTERVSNLTYGDLSERPHSEQIPRHLICNI